MGNLHLSHALTRLGFVKLLVVLTRPTAPVGSVVLLDKYRKLVYENRENHDARWLLPEQGDLLPGRGIGDIERPTNRDTVAREYLQLSVDLGFLRRDLNTWGNYGFALATLFLNRADVPVFHSETYLNELSSKEGFIARIEPGERLIFASSLFSKDPDGLFPILLLLDSQEPCDRQTVAEHYFDRVREWYSSKAKVEFEARKRIECVERERQYRNKAKNIADETQLRKNVQEKGKGLVKQESPWETHVHCVEQVTPRLEYLVDLDFASRERRGYLLTDSGATLKTWALTLLQGQEKRGEEPLIATVLKEELSLVGRLSELYGSGREPPSPTDFEQDFGIVSGFFARVGAAILSYENTYLCLASLADRSNRSLPLSIYEQRLKELADRKRIVYSKLVSGRRYIKLLRSSGLP
jgi:hypothetical protein